MALGLEKDDTVIRRRLVQKMEFVLNDIAAQAEPTDAELSAYLHAHLESFALSNGSLFRQVYLDPEKHGDHLARDTARLLAQLNQAGGKADPAAQGDPFLLEHTFSESPASEVAKQFGKDFAAKLGSILPGEWQGRSSPVTACIWCASSNAPKRRTRAGRSARRRATGVGQRPPAGSEREDLPATAEALPRDHRACGASGAERPQRGKAR